MCLKTKLECFRAHFGVSPETHQAIYVDFDLLDFLLQDDFQCGEAVPGLESISSFEDPVLHLTEKGSLLGDEFSNSTEDSIYFDEQDVSCL